MVQIKRFSLKKIELYTVYDNAKELVIFTVTSLFFSLFSLFCFALAWWGTPHPPPTQSPQQVTQIVLNLGQVITASLSFAAVLIAAIGLLCTVIFNYAFKEKFEGKDIIHKAEITKLTQKHEKEIGKKDTEIATSGEKLRIALEDNESLRKSYNEKFNFQQAQIAQANKLTDNCRARLKVFTDLSNNDFKNHSKDELIESSEETIRELRDFIQRRDEADKQKRFRFANAQGIPYLGNAGRDIEKEISEQINNIYIDKFQIKLFLLRETMLTELHVQEYHKKGVIADSSYTVEYLKVSSTEDLENIAKDVERLKNQLSKTQA